MPRPTSVILGDTPTAKPIPVGVVLPRKKIPKIPKRGIKINKSKM